MSVSSMVISCDVRRCCEGYSLRIYLKLFLNQSIVFQLMLDGMAMFHHHQHHLDYFENRKNVLSLVRSSMHIAYLSFQFELWLANQWEIWKPCLVPKPFPQKNSIDFWMRESLTQGSITGAVKLIVEQFVPHILFRDFIEKFTRI